ncbi:transposase [Candidatus Nitrososphaera gargensis]|uniref:transposase n=1 Tax=Candidatus Nitrososphaera gargensis TaxID=497727 RepID=UPI00164F43C6|nr:transposase [Candidatus Nitrososphaera gargensis]
MVPVPSIRIKPLRRADRRLSRRKKSSKNYVKAKHMLARLYSRIYNRRKDFLHKLSAEYIQVDMISSS